MGKGGMVIGMDGYGMLFNFENFAHLDRIANEKALNSGATRNRRRVLRAKWKIMNPLLLSTDRYLFLSPTLLISSLISCLILVTVPTPPYTIAVYI